MEASSRARAQAMDEGGSSARTLSHGRGGAGNMAKDQAASSTLADLKTPTIKADKYTTGRGGSGNIASNDPKHPELARAAQDVEGNAPRAPDAKVHVGRGGAANVAATDGVKEREEKSGGVKGVLEKVGLKK